MAPSREPVSPGRNPGLQPGKQTCSPPAPCRHLALRWEEHRDTEHSVPALVFGVSAESQVVGADYRAGLGNDTCSDCQTSLALAEAPGKVSAHGPQPALYPNRSSGQQGHGSHWASPLPPRTVGGLTLQDWGTPIIHVGHLLQLGPLADILQECVAATLLIPAQLGLLGVRLEGAGRPPMSQPNLPGLTPSGSLRPLCNQIRCAC